ncbi:hypothetical protein AWC38_SpisGene11853 [Stylophora pistillata]|uniref:Reticulocyte-binding protein 2-like a n=1 Tax=Stylophora pistillata TaxID=50429 RepID=A0A2B4S3G4_STYPI|nr:hypothetical protein AWC38_SpisGene11853 [Stylophora pistillata]
MLKEEYGRVLYERDVAKRSLTVANYRLTGEIQKERHEKEFAVAATDQRNNMEHVHAEPNQSSPRIRSKCSKLPLDHRTRGEKGIRFHTHLKGYATHPSDSQDSNSEDEDERGINTSNNVSNCNGNHSLGGGGYDNDDDGVGRNNEKNNDNSDDNRGNGDKDYENCDENCDCKYHNDDGENTSHDVEDNNGVCAKSYTIQALLCPNADETSVRSDETAESQTEELNVSLRFNSQHSIDEDTGNFSVENSNRNPVGSNSINSNNDTSCENPNTRNDKKTANDRQKAKSFEVGNNAERSAERDGIAASQGARPKIVPQNPVLFDAHYQNGKIPSLETTGIDQNFLARHSTDPSISQSSFTESYDLCTSNKYSNDWTQTSITSNSSSSSLWNLPRSPAPERSGLVLENAYPRELIPRYRDSKPVNYQPVTSMMGQFPNTSNFSCDIDRFNWNENMPSNVHQTSFSSFGDFTAGNGTQTASPSLGVSPLAPAVRYPAVTTPSSRISSPTTTSQFSSITMSGSVARVTSSYDMLSNYGRERVGDFNRDRHSHRDNQANSGLTSPEMVHPKRREESLRNHDLFNNQQEGSLASVSLRDPSLASLEQQVAEIDRILKEREERTKRQREAAQRHREIRETRQREARERKEREEREMREQEERERREREQREMREGEERETREREERENRERMERELEERRERETRIRHDRIVEESLPLQETPLWQ